MLKRIQKSVLTHAPAKRSSLPILNSVKVGKTDGDCYSFVEVNNLDFQVIVYSFTKQLNRGDCVLIDKKQAKASMGADWKCRPDSNMVDFIKNGSCIAVQSRDVSEYPMIPEPAEYKQSLFFGSGDRFFDYLSYLVPIMSVDLVRSTLCGVFLEVSEDGKYTMTATDGHVLAGIEDNGNSVGGDVSAILSGGLCRFLTKLPIKSSSVLIKISDDHVKIKIDTDGVSIVILSRLVDGVYPDYAQVIPRVNSGVYSIGDKDEFIQACKAIKPNTNSTCNKVVVGFGDDTLTLSCKDKESGSQCSVMVSNVSKSKTWDDIDKAGFNVNNLIRIIPKWWDKFTIQGNAPDTAFVLNGPSGDDTFALVMPLRLDGDDK